MEAETKAKSGETRDFVGHDRDVAKRSHAEVGEEGPVADEQDPEDWTAAQPHNRRELSPRNQESCTDLGLQDACQWSRSKVSGVGERDGLADRGGALLASPAKWDDQGCEQASRHGLVTEAGIRIMMSGDGRAVRGQGERLLTETEDPVRGG